MAAALASIVATAGNLGSAYKPPIKLGDEVPSPLPVLSKASSSKGVVTRTFRNGFLRAASGKIWFDAFGMLDCSASASVVGMPGGE
jgi:hypothetical protein